MRSAFFFNSGSLQCVFMWSQIQNAHCSAQSSHLIRGHGHGGRLSIAQGDANLALHSGKILV